MAAGSIFVPAGKVMSMQRRLEYPAKGLRSVRLRFYLETESARTTPGNLSAVAPLF
jgi:hypothetical protein